MTIIKGFDSRYWDGILPDETEFKFVGIKISQSTNFVPAEPIIQWRKSKGKLLRLPFHYWVGPTTFQNPHTNGKAQAQFFYDTMKRIHGDDMGELPPCIDIEHTKAPKGRRSIQSIKAFMNKTEELWGRKPMVYTAGWWFDVWFKPYYTPEKFGGWDIYGYDLWESDPLPDTDCGEWTISAITQTRLDIPYKGFNAKIDINKSTKEWLDSVTVIDKFYTLKEVNQLLEAQEEKLEKACDLKCDISYRVGWNDSLALVGNTLPELAK